MLHVALYQPQIPPNTGNIARQCVGMTAHLHLIGPMAFDLSDHAAKRAGLDYWPNLLKTIHPTPEDFLAWLGDKQPWLVSKFGSQRYDQPAYADEDVLLFGNEISGLPADWKDRWKHRMISIPILGPVRSYNLSNSVALVLGQAMSASHLYPPIAFSPSSASLPHASAATDRP